MAVPSEKQLIQGLVNAAYDGDLKGMKECAERLDFGEGLVETYSEFRGPQGITALHYGAAGGRTPICKYLIEVVGLDIDMQDWQGRTVLNHAIMGHNHQTVAYLVRKGANVNLADHKGYAALHTAAQEGLKETLRLLISNGADMEALSRNGTPLTCAASRGKKEALKILLDNKANPNVKSLHIFTPLVVSILEKSQECINLLLKAGADPNLAGQGKTPLEIAANQADTEAIKLLLKAGANPNVTNMEGITPVEISALLHNLEAVMILLPKTSPLPTIPDWTLRGIVSWVHSQEAKNQREQKRKDRFIESKSKGAEAFKKKDYMDAIFWYTEANACDPMDASVLSNRSLCWARMNEAALALSDAEACIGLRPDWSKAYYRKGVACGMLKNFAGAEEAYTFALNLEPGNAEIRFALRKIQGLGSVRDLAENELGFRIVNSGVF